MANWFKCPKCSEMIEQGQVRELKDHQSASSTLSLAVLGFVSGLIVGFAICYIALAFL